MITLSAALISIITSSSDRTSPDNVHHDDNLDDGHHCNDNDNDDEDAEDEDDDKESSLRMAITHCDIDDIEDAKRSTTIIPIT